MSYEMWVGVHVVDEEEYLMYRRKMYPLLKAEGGDFVVDLGVDKVHKTPSNKTFNRVFSIRFPNSEARVKFFSSDAYLEIRRTHFDAAVDASEVFGEYHRD